METERKEVETTEREVTEREDADVTVGNDQNDDEKDEANS